jgi:uncharacterized protein involved in exopolysaccharide biosynthesis
MRRRREPVPTDLPPRPYEAPVVPRVAPPSPNGSAPATPTTGLGRAVRRRPLWVAIPLLLLLAAGIAAGLARAPVYQAESRLLVGKVNPGTPTLPGFVQASTMLADAYSRSIGATDVIEPLAARLRLAPLTVAARLTASPVPQSPVIRVIATGPSARAATTLSALASVRLQRYVTRLSAASGDGPRLLASYRRASLAVSRAIARYNAANAAYARHPTPMLAQALDAARADRDAAQLSARAAGAAYASDQQSYAASTGIVSVLALAQQASSDRTHKLELLAFIGLLVGGVLGLGLAWLREQRASRAPAPAA